MALPSHEERVMFFSMKELQQRYRRSRTQIYRWIKQYGFPKPWTPNGVDASSTLAGKRHARCHLLFLRDEVYTWENSRRRMKG